MQGMDFSGQVVLVTGSSTGIGKATVLMFAEGGADVVVHGYQSMTAAQAVVKEVEAKGRRCLLVRGDMAVKADVERVMAEVNATFGRVDVLVNNAGSMVGRARLEELSEDLWDRIMNVNLKSAFLVSQAVLPLMKPLGRGRIIHLTSVAARNGGSLGALAYATSKGGVATLTRSMAKDLAEYNILVNAVAPGVITTPFHDKFTPSEQRDNFKQQIPLHREGTAEETAGAILFLASSFADYISGQIIDVNGAQWFS